MPRYVENSFSKKAARNSKSIKDAGKIAAGIGATAYFAAKSTPKPKTRANNINPSIPGCLVGLIFVILGFVLAFTVANDFISGMMSVIGLSALGILIFWLVSYFSSKDSVKECGVEDRVETANVKIAYHPTQIGDENVRYALVQEGERTLFVIGLNPSTADASTPDPTMQSVLRIAEYNGFDGFIMLNLYPLRATQPYNLPKERDDLIHESNIQKIHELLEGRSNVEVWLAFGANANRRDYLIPCYKDIVKVFEPYNPKWYYINNLTKEGFPPHPLYQQVSYFKEFPMEQDI